jgi:hypothetical protein
LRSFAWRSNQNAWTIYGYIKSKTTDIIHLAETVLFNKPIRVEKLKIPEEVVGKAAYYPNCC